MSWDTASRKLTLRYDGMGAPSPATYDWARGEWIEGQKAGQRANAESGERVDMSVRQDLNQPPVLWARVSGTDTGFVLWDPNPQFEELELGKASLYRWKDATGNDWSGILALPPTYDAKRRYPLVIQTHGYRGDLFFADGAFITGSGGRALTAKGVIVLQMDENFTDVSTPHEASDHLAAFESAVDHLVADGLVDRGRVGVIGFSRTCFHVRYALIHHPNLFRAASITDGFDPSYGQYMLYLGPVPGGANESASDPESINGGPPYGDGLMNWVRNANGFNLDKIQTPLSISAFASLYGDWETYVGLRRLNKPVDMRWWWRQNTPHILIQPAQRYASQQSAVDWFDFWLNGREDPDASKAEQYAHWRELRLLRDSSVAKTAVASHSDTVPKERH